MEEWESYRKLRDKKEEIVRGAQIRAGNYIIHLISKWKCLNKAIYDILRENILSAGQWRVVGQVVSAGQKARPGGRKTRLRLHSPAPPLIWPLHPAFPLVWAGFRQIYFTSSSRSSLGLGGTWGLCSEVLAGREVASLAFAEGQLGLLGRVLLKGGDCLWLDRLSWEEQEQQNIRWKVSGSLPGQKSPSSRKCIQLPESV